MESTRVRSGARSTHIDVVGLRFNIWIEDEPIMRDGKFLSRRKDCGASVSEGRIETIMAFDYFNWTSAKFAAADAGEF